MTAIPRVLSIAGTDPTGGAGIHADLKAISALGGYGMAVVTVLVAQNTHGVRSVHAPSVSFLREQLLAVSEDVVIDAVKIGMLGVEEIIDAVEAWLDEARPPLVVLDPVMISTSGHRLLDADAERALLRLCSRADLLTPNLPELAILVGEPTAVEWSDALRQAELLARSSGAFILVKGGHLGSALSPDAIVAVSGEHVEIHEVEGERVETSNTHGTGCSLSSAMATLGAAQRRDDEGGSPVRDAPVDWPAALATAKHWLTAALRGADALAIGSGNGPIDHFALMRGARGNEPEPVREPSSFTRGCWDDTVELRHRIDKLPFVRRLGEGTLEQEAFEWYLEQDALYLSEYSRLLARASQLAPTSAEQVFWAGSAVSAITAEAQLHRERLGSRRQAAPAPTTLAYLGHLHSASSRAGYGELVAALLPCFWIYTDLGTRLASRSHEGHAYADWLTSYADPAFAAATAEAIDITERAARSASNEERSRMREAFVRSSEHEHAFFDAPLLAREC